MASFRPDHHRARVTLSNGLRAIEDEIHNELLNLPRIGLDGGEARSEVQLDVHHLGDGRAYQRLDFPDQLREVDSLQHKPALTRVGQQLARQIGRAFAGAHNLPEISPDGSGVREFRQSQTGVSEYPGEQVIEIVRDAPGEQAQALQLLSVLEVTFEPFAVRNVANVELNYASFRFRVLVGHQFHMHGAVALGFQQQVGEAGHVLHTHARQRGFHIGKVAERFRFPPFPAHQLLALVAQHRLEVRVCIRDFAGVPIGY